MFANTRGEAAGIERPMGATEAAIDRARDLAMLHLRRRKVSPKLIARYFNVSVRTVQYRLKAIPPEAIQHYGNSPLEWLDSA